MARSLFGDIELDSLPYRVLIGSRRKQDIVDFSPRASVGGISIIHNELGLYQSQLQTSWQHGFGFPWSEDEQGYMRPEGNIDTRHAGIAMLYTAVAASLPADDGKRNGFTTWRDAEWSWGEQGLHRYDGALWTQEYGVVSPIQVKTTVWAKKAAATTLTFDITNADHTIDNLLLVTIHLKSNVSITSVTCNGDAMTEHSSVGTTPKVALYKLVNPDRGISLPIVVTLGASSDIVATATQFSNVDQSTPLDSPVTDSGTGTTATKAVTSAADDLAFALLAVDDDVALTLGAGQTALADLFRGNLVAASSHEPGAGSVTMSWTWTGSLDFELIGVNINNATHTNVSFALGLGDYLFYCPQGGRIRKVSKTGVHSDAGNGTNSTDYSMLIAHNGYVYALKRNTNIVYYGSEADLGDLEGDPADDTNEIYIGAGGVPVKGVVRAFNKLFWMREDGLWELGEDRIARQVLNFTNERSSLNFRSAAEYKGFLVYAIRDQLFQWNGTRASPSTPPRLSDDFPYLTYGRFDNFVAVGNFLYMTARTNEATYTESLLCWDGAGWHILMDLITDGAGTVSAMGYDTANERLWLHITTDSVDATKYIQFQSKSDLPYANFPTSGTHRLIHSRWDAGYRRVIKSADSILLEGSNLSSTRTLAVYYSLDGAAFALWGTANADGVTEMFAPSPLVSVEYNYIVLAVYFVTATATESPILESLTLRFLMRPDEAYGYGYDVVLGNDIRFEGREDVRTAAEMDEALETLRASKDTVPFKDHFGRDHRAYVSSISTNDVEEHLVSHDDYANIEQVAHINIVVPRAR